MPRNGNSRKKLKTTENTRVKQQEMELHRPSSGMKRHASDWVLYSVCLSVLNSTEIQSSETGQMKSLRSKLGLE